MADRGGKRKRSRGNRSTEARLHARVDFVGALMARHRDAETVIAKAAASEFRIARRTCERDMARVREAWAAESAAELPFARARHSRNLERLRERAEGEGKLATAARLAIEEARIDGVAPATTLNVNLGGKVGAELDGTLATLSLDELQKLEELQSRARGSS